MSRSNPSTELRNPAVRWHSWGGKDGRVKYYDKDSKKNIDSGDDFTFILLDELCVIKGWSDEFNGGMTSNEVKSVSDDKLIVRVFKGPIIARGLYSEIKDTVKSAGGKFTANLYIAFKVGDALKIGSVQFKGAALNAWVEFKKLHGDKIFSQAVKISGSTDGKKGAVSFKIPTFELTTLSKESNEEANRLDVILQAYLKPYLAKNHEAKTDGHQEDAPHEEQDQMSEKEEIF